MAQAFHLQAQENLLPPSQYQPSAPPPEHHNFEPEVQGVLPWELEQENIYREAPPPQYLLFPAPQHQSESDQKWQKHRESVLREWGKRREKQLHRFPSCLMDQMMSG